MVDAGLNAPLAAKVRAFTVTLDVLLIALVLAWQLATGWSFSRLAIAIALSLPLLAPLPGLCRANRRTFAWTTLCVIPYLVVGITETIARPAARGWTGTCLALSLTLFVTLIAYLRITRGAVAATEPSAP